MQIIGRYQAFFYSENGFKKTRIAIELLMQISLTLRAAVRVK